MTERFTPFMTRAASCRRHAQERDIAEADGTGQTVREYLWLPDAGYAGTDLPLAVVGDVDTATPVVYYTHADQSLFCRFDSRAAIEHGTIEPGPAGQDYRCVQDRCVGCRVASGLLRCRFTPKRSCIRSLTLRRSGRVAGRKLLFGQHSAGRCWTAITGSLTHEHRLPGQWYQLEAGLHYNWHRPFCWLASGKT
jgi:hypothetical protein